jgi:hypothetical protein
MKTPEQIEFEKLERLARVKLSKLPPSFNLHEISETDFLVFMGGSSD